MALPAGLMAGLLSWGAGELALVRFTPAFHMNEQTRQRIETSTAEVRRQLQEATTRTATVSYGALAALLGGALGAAGGIAGRSRSRGLTAAAVGLLLGAAAGASATAVLCQVFHQWFSASTDTFSKDLLRPLLLHAGMWAPAGLAGGLALGLGEGGWRRGAQTAFGGLLGAAFGVVLSEIGGALAFPNARTTHPYGTEWGARLLVHLVVALTVSALAAWSADNVRLSRSRSSPAGSGSS
ncbi:hypothetical protein [Tautonia sociabilis]|uniref:Uncharacterized protein n=1 Tax=Tautonia sociabilis TaxID=2080755 RepID=A0A432MJP6_9BACT|nr:hypothetical protein [Tautonia sociabilis]RUL87427.1 hypothetical protein TsocGM_12155 [Tautonia sociabilis]